MNSNNASIQQAKDTAQAFVLISLLIAYFSNQKELIFTAICIVIICMIWPAAFRPFARLWFGLSHVLGSVVSKIILVAVFILIVTPIGLIRSRFGSDLMKRKSWKNGNDSVFVKRDQVFSASDFEKTF